MCDMQRLLESGPVDTAGYDSLSLVAEQVSHHPPGEYACIRAGCVALKWLDRR